MTIIPRLQALDTRYGCLLNDVMPSSSSSELEGIVFSFRLSLSCFCPSPAPGAGKRTDNRSGRRRASFLVFFAFHSYCNFEALHRGIFDTQINLSIRFMGVKSVYSLRRLLRACFTPSARSAPIKTRQKTRTCNESDLRHKIHPRNSHHEEIQTFSLPSPSKSLWSRDTSTQDNHNIFAILQHIIEDDRQR